MPSLAERHRMRVLAAQQPRGVGPLAHASGYDLMLAKLAADRARLKLVQSMERKAVIKREVLPSYTPYIQGVLEGQRGIQDVVLTTLMVWRIDAGDYAGALDIAEYVLRHDLAMPDQYHRTAGCIVAEEIADAALRPGVQNFPVAILARADALTSAEDMPDEVRAKLQKAIGYALLDDEPEQAKNHLLTALKLNVKCGVKKDIERLDRRLKNLAAGAAAAEPSVPRTSGGADLGIGSVPLAEPESPPTAHPAGGRQ